MKNQEEITHFIANERGMLDMGTELAQNCQPGAIIYLQGELGAGKTTLVRGFIHACGYSGQVKSPTYTLVETYSIKQNLQIFHFDLYRLNSARELLDIGLEDYLTNHGICLIEWPEKAENILPKAHISCRIEIPADGVGRKITITYT